MVVTNPTELVHSLRNSFDSGKTRPVKFREQQLKALLKMYEENTDAMIEALTTDLRKAKQESVVMETDFLINDIKHTIANLNEWVKPERPCKGFVNALDSLYIYNDPYGVVLVMGAWNYPIQLTLLPVAGAIAAGNCVVIKPSEISAASAKFMAETIPKYLDKDCYAVYEGAVEETTALLKEKFDYVFFTGSTNVGRIVHKAANDHLTPVTLELGGKSPVYLDKTVDLKLAAKRILWGKFVNAGQTCIAPDYLMCTREVQDKFVEAAKQVLHEFYGNDPKKSPDFGRIVSARQYQRLSNLMKGATVAIGGMSDASDRYIAPTILTDIKPENPIMKEEIFGPILPIMVIDSAYSAMKFINSHDKPLVFYIFSNNSQDVQLLIDNTSSGGVLVNDTIMHLATDLPFGGVGASGMGMYHAKYTFDTFVHKKSCLVKKIGGIFGGIGESLAKSRYPPYSDSKINFLKLLLKRRQGLISCSCLSRLLVFTLGFLTAVGVKYACDYYDFQPKPFFK